MKSPVYIWIVLICSFVFTSASGQEVRYLTTQNGLNNGAINDIVQDSSGYIWLATWDGIARYDGFSFKDYKPQLEIQNGLPSRQIIKLFLDSRNNLWAITYSGVGKYNRDLDQFQKCFLDGIDSTYKIGMTTADLCEVDEKIFLRYNDGIYFQPMEDNPTIEKFKRCQINELNLFPPFKIRSINSQLVVIKNYINRNETFFYDANLQAAGSSIDISFDTLLNFEGIVSEIESIDSTRHILIRDGNVGITKIGDSGLIYEVLLHDIEPKKILYTSNNMLWVVPGDKGLLQVNLHTGLVKEIDYDNPDHNYLLGNQISSLFKDFSGNMWIGHSGEGISIINLNEKAFNTYRNNPDIRNSLSCNSVMGFCEFGDGMLIATDYEGVDIMKFDPETGDYNFSNMKFPDTFWRPDNYISIWSIVKESEEVFWMCGNFGLIKAIYRNGKWKHQQYMVGGYNSKLRTLFLDKNKNLWIGTYNGLFLFPFNQRDSMGYFTYRPDPDIEHSLSNQTITEILLDSKNRFWIGTRDNGINLLESNYNDLNFSSRTAPELRFSKILPDTTKYSLNNPEVNCLFEYYDGTIWAGTQGGGINIIDPDKGVIDYITIENGLPGDNIFGILPDDYGKLWISTNKGICSISFTNDTRNIVVYNPSDGIQGNVFMIQSFYKSSNDDLYFGGRNGLTFFDPDEIEINNTQPKIVFTNLRVFDQEIQIQKPFNNRVLLEKAINETSDLKFSYKDYDIRIGVAAIHFQDPSENRIMYKLEGFHKEWNNLPSEERYINLANLNPGKYQLIVKASNSDNVWTSKPKILNITITPPWFGAWYGYLIFIVVGLLLISSAFYPILRQQSLRHQIQLEEQKNINLKELNESKLKFFTNISHDLRTPLSLVLAPIEYLFKNEQTTPFIKEQLALSIRNAKMLKRLINNIIDFRKYDAGKLKLRYERRDIKKFIEEIGKNFESLQSGKKVQMLYHLPEYSTIADFDPDKLEQVLYNILSNALKYVTVDGTVLVTLSTSKNPDKEDNLMDEFISISIFNEGNTIPEDHLENIFNRFFQSEEYKEGSGIGLSVAERLIHLHSGTITVRNLEDSGVEFTIKIPRYAKEEINVHLEDVVNYEHIETDTLIAKTTSKEAPEADKEFKLLVIEDNDELRSFYKTLLSPKYEFYEARDGLEGMKMVDEILPDLVISDVVMPEKYGYEVCREIKENMSTCHIPVILLTAKDAPEQIVFGYKSGADAYIIKPFDYEILVSQIEMMISNREKIRNKYTSIEFLEESTKEKPKTKDDIFMETLNTDIEDNIFNEDYNVFKLSDTLNISRNHLYRKVKALTGCSTVEYIRIFKLNKAAEILRTQQYSIKEVCYKTGFRDQSYFTKSFKNHFKKNPTEYVKSFMDN